jgi:hypothetical protein
MDVKKVSEWDKAYMRRLGEYQDEANAAWRAEWRAKPLHERLELSAAGRFGMPVSARRDPEEPEQIYERARRLGLYRA